MHTTGTHIAYLHLCHRKRWLFASGMQMEHRSALVAEGRQADLRNLEDFVNLASPSAKPPPPPPAKRNREQAPEVTNVHWQRHKSMAAREDMRIPLVPEHGYHIFNRGNGGHRTFFSDENYRYFLMKYAQYMKDYWDTYAYCLLPNHFHLAIRVKPAASVLAAGIRDFETADRKLVSRLEKDLPNLNTAALADLRNLADFVNLASHHEALRTYLLPGW